MIIELKLIDETKKELIFEVPEEHKHLFEIDKKIQIEVLTDGSN